MTKSLLLTAVLAFAVSPARAAAPTVADAQAFMDRAEKTLDELGLRSRFASWAQATYIIYDTEWLAADASRAYSAEAAKLAREARVYDVIELPADLKRKFLFLKLAVEAPSPPTEAEQKELADVKVWLEGTYSKGKHCRTPEKCLSLDDMEDAFRTSRDPADLLDMWKGWRTISPPMRPKYQRLAELSNKGSRELGFKDTADLWRAGYDMTPEQFSAELDRLWLQLKPLYASLHAYVRRRLADKYGKDVVGKDGLIPAHLLGNMWGQSWGNVYDLVSPPKSTPAFDLTERLKAKGVDEKGMVKYGEGFFTSLGMPPLPATFWERSMIVKPRDREVVCHASAWDVENSDDLRIKMCTRINEDDFVTVHHELGHNFYQRGYKAQPYFFRGSANDGFHEALGDTIALSVTPAYLKTVGLIDKVPGPEGDNELLLKAALEKVAFQPFGLLVDKWRWGVFDGSIPPERYNKAWWDLVRKYQGLKPPVERTEADFDPGAKYHIPGNTPYARYFLANVLQFQFYRALCRQSGHTGPLHQCSFYGNKEVGKKLEDMMAMGASRPWPDALEAATGQREMDATAIAEYFAPLKTWLDQQNKGQKVGWSE
ncbi:MAG: M2 family metallopeptidase [Elusimicrobia bacterium]|nr:M2 family metallopeptidase [Elusimicrobiota bacterium]